MSEIKPPEMVRITWHDVMSANGPLMQEEDLADFQLTKAMIIGFLVGENEDVYFLAKEWWETDQFKYLHVIPKKTAIVEIVTLEPVKRGK